MGLCVFNLPIFLCIIVRMFCTSSYYHQIRTKNERSCNNGIRCITCYVIPHIDSILQLSVTWQPLVNVSYPSGGTCWNGNKIDYPDGWVRWRSVWVKGSRSSCCSNPPELMLSRHSGHTLILSFFFNKVKLSADGHCLSVWLGNSHCSILKWADRFSTKWYRILGTFKI